MIELAICIGIIIILATVVLPSYRHYVVRTNTVATQAYLLELVSLQNQLMFDNQGYTERVEDLGAVPLERVTNNYDIRISNVNNTAQPPIFSLQAIAKKDSVQAVSGPLTINHLGQKSAAWRE